MYGLPIVSPGIIVYVSAICITRMETRISIVYRRVSYPSVSVLYYISMVAYAQLSRLIPGRFQVKRRSHVLAYQALPFFLISACNIENLGVAWGRG